VVETQSGRAQFAIIPSPNSGNLEIIRAQPAEGEIELTFQYGTLLALEMRYSRLMFAYLAILDHRFHCDGLDGTHYLQFACRNLDRVYHRSADPATRVFTNLRDENPNLDFVPVRPIKARFRNSIAALWRTARSKAT
jgi:hypothetical protein